MLFRSVIPGLDASAGGHHLGDGHSFTFSTADTANEGVTDERQLGVGNVEHTEEEIADFINECFALNTGETSFGAGGLGSQGEIKCLSDS